MLCHRTWDHSAVVHGIWKKAAEINARIWVERVPTKDNIADDPSREDYSLLDKLKAVRVAPVLDEAFMQPGTWEALSISSIYG